MSLYARLAALVLVLLAGAGVWWKFDHALAAREAAGYNRRAIEDANVMRVQQDQNRELQRAAELKYTVRAASREQFFIAAAKGVHDASASLATCPVPEPVRVRLNGAAACAREDRPATCGTGEPVPDPG